MQRIRKERSPVPAYVMPSGHCQPAPAPFCLAGGGGKRGWGRRRTSEAKGQSCPRNQSRENSDRSQGPISIFGRSFACSLFVHPTTKIPATTPGVAVENNILRQPRPFLFTPSNRGCWRAARSKGLGRGRGTGVRGNNRSPAILPRLFFGDVPPSRFTVCYDFTL